MLSREELRAQFHQAVLDRNIQAAEALAEQINQATYSADCFIINITEDSYGPYNHWHYLAPITVQGKKKREAYSVMRVVPRQDHIDLGEGKVIMVNIGAKEIAEDIARICNEGVGENSFLGVFVSDTEEVDEEVLQEMGEKLDAFYDRILESADADHSRGGAHALNISDLQRKAARWRFMQKPWLPDLRPKKECPMCAESIPAQAAICGKCGAVLDEDKAKKYLPSFREQSETETSHPVTVPPETALAEAGTPSASAPPVTLQSAIGNSKPKTRAEMKKEREEREQKRLLNLRR